MAYTTAEKVTLLAGAIAVDLRTDDDDATDLLIEAVNYATGQVDFYCSRYSAAELAANQWVQDVATFIAVRWLCMHRLNKPPRSIKAEWEDTLKPQLERIQEGKADVPRAAESRRAVTVTTQRVDLRKANNQIVTDRSRSTGAAQGYRRPTDYNAPDQR